MWHIVHIPIQRQHCHVKAIRLWRELEVGVHVDARHAEGVSWERLHGRVDDVVTERDVHLAWRGARDAVARRHHVATRHERPAASGKRQV